MVQTLEESRESFLSAVRHNFPISRKFQLVLLTHLLEDRPVILRNLANVCSISGILGIPYSVVPEIQSSLSSDYHVAVHRLETLLNADDLLGIVTQLIAKSNLPVAIVETGGYFAPIGNRLKERLVEGFLGIVEDTESGHRRYEQCPQLTFPVVSVARSPLKMVEDTLIGPSVVFSVERKLREMGETLSGANLGVLGFGRIGSGIAREAAQRRARVAVFDKNPIRRAIAAAEGFSCPDRERVLSNSQILIGAAGCQSISSEDFEGLFDGVLLASASSKQSEFDIQALQAGALQVDRGADLERFQLRNGKTVYLMRGGCPVNFRDSAVVGPSISLTQAEIIVALRTLADGQGESGLTDVPQRDREKLAAIWLEHFLDIRGSGLPLKALDF